MVATVENEIGDPRLETLLINLGKWLKTGNIVKHVALDYLIGGTVRVHRDKKQYESSFTVFASLY